MSLKDFLKGIADVLREETSDNAKINAKDFADYIKSACEDKWQSGYDGGYNAGYNDGYNEAQLCDYDEFWDTYQDNGNREHYSFAFGGKGWTDSTFKPKYDIRPGSTVATNLFAYSQITDLIKILNRQGIVLDTSKSTDIGALFNGCTKLVTCPPIDASSSKHCGAIFYNCTHIDGIVLKIKNDGSQTFTNTFTYCNKLYNLEIDGVIGQDINLKYSDLSKASLLNVLNCLSTNTTGKTATFKSTYLLNDADVKNAITAKSNWTISFV